MKMSAEEVKDFWRDFCRRRGLSAEVIAKGEAKIDADPEYWADHTMWQLFDTLSDTGGAGKNAGGRKRRG